MLEQNNYIILISLDFDTCETFQVNQTTQRFQHIGRYSIIYITMVTHIFSEIKSIFIPKENKSKINKCTIAFKFLVWIKCKTQYIMKRVECRLPLEAGKDEHRCTRSLFML